MAFLATQGRGIWKLRRALFFLLFVFGFIFLFCLFLPQIFNEAPFVKRLVSVFAGNDAPLTAVSLPPLLEEQDSFTWMVGRGYGVGEPFYMGFLANEFHTK